MPPHDPTYNKEELKACFAVIKKIMEMDEAKSFNSPVDPASLGLHETACDPKFMWKYKCWMW